ncbi:MAG: SDR family oxidoreductase [Acidobacteria bacterium]|nr:SDR family oxidoreductase [Acidobacteriota bacterium]
MTPLEGRTALVTGATGALGAAIAHAGAHAGARLLVSGRQPDALAALARTLSTQHRADVVAAPCDLSSGDEVRKLADAAHARFGGLDILVNAAAVLGPIGPSWDNDPTEWDRTVHITLCAAVQLCQRCLPLMPLAGGRGKIINISGGGATSPRPGFSAYAAAKTALVRFSETLAAELGERPIDVNCVAPGFVKSAMTRAVIEAGPARAGRDEYEKAVATADAATDDAPRAAALCVFLASAAGDGITGRLISAHWDPWALLGEHRADLQGTDVYTLRRILPRDRGFEGDPS